MSPPPACYFMATAAVHLPASQPQLYLYLTSSSFLQVGGHPQGALQISLACSLTTALSSSQRGAQRHRR